MSRHSVAVAWGLREAASAPSKFCSAISPGLITGIHCWLMRAGLSSRLANSGMTDCSRTLPSEHYHFVCVLGAVLDSSLVSGLAQLRTALRSTAQFGFWQRCRSLQLWTWEAGIWGGLRMLPCTGRCPECICRVAALCYCVIRPTVR